MIYPFKCPDCGKSVDVYRPAIRAGEPEPCPACGSVMARVWTAPQIDCPNIDYFDSGLGCHVRSRSDVRNAVSRIRDKGVDIVEIGNEKPRAQPKRKKYDLPRGFKDAIKNAHN